MAQNSGPPPIIFILAALVIAGGGFYWFTNQNSSPTATNSATPVEVVPGADPPSTPAPTPSPEALAIPTTLPQGSSVKVDGSTSMVRLNKNLGTAFQAKFPGVGYTWKANGSSNGIKALVAKEIDVAASSRPLKEEEVSQGLVAVPVKTDAIAVIIGKANAFSSGLTSEQLRNVFSGQVNNWSQVGGTALPLRVVNRNPESGTYGLFKDAVLGGNAFGNGPNWTTMSRDVTTELIQKLGTNGIGYANYSQIKTQKTIKALAIDGATPDSPNYGLLSVLYYVYRSDSSEAAKAFIAFATSPEGQAVAVVE